jgi:hypothetical protein
LEARLPPFAFNVPLKMPEPQQPLNMIVREGDDPYEISEAFIAQNDLDAGELLPKMVCARALLLLVFRFICHTMSVITPSTLSIYPSAHHPRPPRPRPSAQRSHHTVHDGPGVANVTAGSHHSRQNAAARHACQAQPFPIAERHLGRPVERGCFPWAAALFASSSARIKAAFADDESIILFIRQDIIR